MVLILLLSDYCFSAKHRAFSSVRAKTVAIHLNGYHYQPLAAVRFELFGLLANGSTFKATENYTCENRTLIILVGILP